MPLSFYLIETLRATSVCSQEPPQGERRWFATALILAISQKWITSFPSGVEDATREGRGVVKKRSDSSSGCLNDHPPVMHPHWLEMSRHASAAAVIQEVNSIYYLLSDCTPATRSDRFLISDWFSFWGPAAARWGFVCIAFLITWNGRWIFEALFECRLNLPLERLSSLCNNTRVYTKDTLHAGCLPEQCTIPTIAATQCWSAKLWGGWALSLLVLG